MAHEKTLKALHAVNVPRVACEHMFGEDHGTAHRLAVGFAVMVVGIAIGKEAGVVLAAFAGHFTGAGLVDGFFELFGGGVHAVGATPYIEWLMKRMASE